MLTVAGVLQTSVKYAAKRLAARMPSAKTTELFNEMVQDAALQAESFIGKLINNMGGDPDEAAARISSLVTEKEMAAFMARLLPEAVASPTEERRRMMAAAMAGVYHPDFSIEEKSRITRAVSMLEPSDVIILGKIQPITWIHQGGPFGRKIPWGRPATNWSSETNEQVTSVSALVSAGCVAESEHEGQLCRDRTPLGSAVLRFLGEWTAELSTPENDGGASAPHPPSETP